MTDLRNRPIAPESQANKMSKFAPILNILDWIARLVGVGMIIAVLVGLKPS